MAPYGVEAGETLRIELWHFKCWPNTIKTLPKPEPEVEVPLLPIMKPWMKTIDHRLDVNLTAKGEQIYQRKPGGILLYDFDQDSGAATARHFPRVSVYLPELQGQENAFILGV